MGDQRPRGVLELVHIERLGDEQRQSKRLVDLPTVTARDERRRLDLVEIVDRGLGRLRPASRHTLDVELVAEPACPDEAGGSLRPFDQGVGARRAAVHDARNRTEPEAELFHARDDSVDEASRHGRHLRGRQGAGLHVDCEDIRERPSDVDPENAPRVAHVAVGGTSS